MKMVDIIQQKLQATFHPTLLEVVDDSQRHAGHREAGTSGESHFNVLVVSSHFENMPPVKRHQAIYALLKEEMRKKIHALSLQTFTPEEYAAKK